MPSALPQQQPHAVTHHDMANAIRFLTLDAVAKAKSGHSGMPMGMADVATVLWGQILKFNPGDPSWPDRDRVVLSGGHGSMLLYALGYLTGYAAMTRAEIENFRQLHSRTPGHPEHDIAIGVETTTGPLGQGLANAVGMAVAERHLAARFGDDLIDHHTYILAGDGDLMEGVSHEAASLAGHLRLNRLIALYDDNQISIDGPTGLSFTDDTLARFAAYGWATQRIDGHDPVAIKHALDTARAADRPSLIACRTIIGFGAPTKAGTNTAHGALTDADEIAGARQKLGWPHPAFVVPDEILSHWRSRGQRSAVVYDQWQERHRSHAQRDAFDAALNGTIPAQATAALTQLRAKTAAAPSKRATRQCSGDALDTLASLLPNLLGGSADLTGSNNTLAKGMATLDAAHYGGRYLYYGVREHGMAAVMNGLALHGGVIPYGGTFLQFADYARPAIRLAALMGLRVIHVLTHDSIGLGEDGPTHQPVEHLASLRAMPNLYVFRPADGLETAECWELALNRADGPSALCLSRQALPTLPRAAHENLSARGAYILAEADGPRQITLLATGSEVALALEARAQLAARGIKAAVVSMPCWEIFAHQDQTYQTSVLGNAPRIGIEAAARLGWDRWLGAHGAFIGMAGFGASAPAEILYQHFGITASAIVAAAQQLCHSKE